MALDRVNNRMFVPEPGNIRILVYQLDEQGLHVRHTADRVIGHASLLGRRRQSEVNRRDSAGGAENGLAVDPVNQRLFARDRSRILVYDVHPGLLGDYPEATHVIGQPDFDTLEPGGGARKFRGGEVIVDPEQQRLFVEDGERILVFDVRPERLENFPRATYVIGQPDFDSRLHGSGRNRLSRSHGIAFDPDGQRLFVSDQGNNRVLVFDVEPDRLRNDPDAIAVLGQPDFETTATRFAGAAARPAERRGFRQITPGGLDYDPVHERLFVSQLADNRILVFEAAPEMRGGEIEAFAVIGQPDFTTFEPAIAQDRFAFPKDPSVDPDKQMLYVSEGFPGGNRVLGFDISPENLRSGLAAVDVIGHVDDSGRDDFDRRMANDRLDARTTTMARAVALDAIDHRLWVADQYNNRVLGFQLDAHNRLLEREASWVFGQRNFQTARASRTRTGLNVPLAVAYDGVDKRLYVGDGWHDRVLIYDVDPATLHPGGNQEAIVVLGQPDFETQDPRPARSRFDLGVDIGRGIASSMLPVGIAIDEERRRAYISDGGNHRILAFDIDRDRLESGADAVGVIGQPDFTSKEPRLTRDGLNWPGHLAYDAEDQRLFAVDNRNHRIVVFDLASGEIGPSRPASFVIGQADFTTTNAPGPRQVNGQTLAFPNGIAFDPAMERLYVADQGNHRVLVFDAAPERMMNQPSALAVLGQPSEVHRSDQVLLDISGQDQLYDPRGLAFDSEQQQLYVTDSHWARLLVFSFPETRRTLEIPADGARMFSSLDPVAVLRPWETRTGYGRIDRGVPVTASWLMTRTALHMEPLTEQQSRILISQSGGSIPRPATHFLTVAYGADGARTTVSISNPSDAPAIVRLTLRDDRGEARTNRTLEPGTQLTLEASDVAMRPIATASLSVDSSNPVSVSAWTEQPNKYGEMVLTTLPVASSSASDRILPNVTLGGGYQVDVVLLNPGAEEARGVLSLFDDGGGERQSTPYTVAPDGIFVWQPDSANPIPRTGYAVARPDDPDSGLRPMIASLTRRADDGLVTMTGSDAPAELLRGHVPIDTMPDLIRHGRGTTLDVVVANPGTHGASVRMILRNLEGEEVDRSEQLVLPGSQRHFTLGDLFDRTKFAGSLTLVSDVGIGISARQRIINLRGDEILTDIPVLADDAEEPLLFPYMDGNGLSTQLSVLAHPGERVDSAIGFFRPDGEPLEVILR